MLNEETRHRLREMNFGVLVDALYLQEKQAECLALPFDDRMNLAGAIGRQACMQGFRSRYIRVPDLLELLSKATLTTSSRCTLLKKFSGYRLLVLDEWLLNDLKELDQHFFF